MASYTAKDLPHLRNLLEARTDHAGQPKKGFKDNVAMLRRLIADIEAQGRSAT